MNILWWSKLTKHVNRIWANKESPYWGLPSQISNSSVFTGIFRGSLEPSPDQPAHPGAKVKAIVSDGLNQLVVTGDDSKQLKFWKFQTNKLVKGQIEKRASGIRQMVLHR